MFIIQATDVCDRNLKNKPKDLQEKTKKSYQDKFRQTSEKKEMKKKNFLIILKNDIICKVVILEGLFIALKVF